MNDSTIALTVDDIYNIVNPDEPIPFSDPRYIDLSPARGGLSTAAIVERRIKATRPPNYQRLLITGRRGSGKSTELRGLQDNLEAAGFLTVYLDVEQVLALADIEYLDLLIAIAQTLDRIGQEKELGLSPDLLTDVSDWFAKVTQITSKSRSAEVTVSSEFSIGTEIPFLTKILAALTSRLRSDSVNRREVRRQLEPHLPDLIERLKRLVDNVTLKAKAKGFTGLVIIVDSLEKMQFKYLDDHLTTNHAMLFVEHAEQLKSFPCHTIYTVPVSLLNDRNLGTTYDVFLIPMVKIATPTGAPYEAGRKLLYQVVARRVDVEHLFSDPALVYKLIETSGGVVRDLIRLLLLAADQTVHDSPITAPAVKRAIRSLVRDYGRLVHEKDLKLLHSVARNPHIAASADLDRLMYNRLVLPYINDDDWVDLHPAVRQSAPFRASLKITRDG